jgi:ribonuclease P protein component
VLAKRNRIVSGLDYRRLVRSGRRARGALTLAYARRTTPGDPMRMGVIVARNVGNAVVRNRVRRRIKAVGWSLASEFEGLDVVLRALPSSAAAGFDELDAEVREHVQTLASGRSR